MYVVPNLSSEASTALNIEPLDRPAYRLLLLIHRWVSSHDLIRHTPLIYVVFTLISKISMHSHSRSRVVVLLVTCRAVAFGHNDNFSTRDTVGSNRLSHKFF